MVSESVSVCVCVCVCVRESISVCLQNFVQRQHAVYRHSSPMF